MIDNPQNTSSDSLSSQTAGDKISLNSSESQYMLVSVIILVTIIVILIITIIFILYKNHQYSRDKTGGGDSGELDSARYPLYTASENSSYPGSVQVSRYIYN